MTLRSNTYQQELNFDAPAFYNTNRTGVQDSKKFEADNLSQEQLVLEVFNVHRELAWFECQSYLPEMNEVSLKRSISNLKKKGKLIKTNTLIMGSAGKQVHKYKLA